MIKLLQPHAVDTAPHRQVESVPSPTHRAYLPPLVGDPLDTGTADSYLPLPGTRYKGSLPRGVNSQGRPREENKSVEGKKLNQQHLWKVVKGKNSDKEHLWKEDTWN